MHNCLLDMSACRVTMREARYSNVVPSCDLRKLPQFKALRIRRYILRVPAQYGEYYQFLLDTEFEGKFAGDIRGCVADICASAWRLPIALREGEETYNSGYCFHLFEQQRRESIVRLAGYHVTVPEGYEGHKTFPLRMWRKAPAIKELLGWEGSEEEARGLLESFFIQSYEAGKAYRLKRKTPLD
jgi:hypothetical protein